MNDADATFKTWAREIEEQLTRAGYKQTGDTIAVEYKDMTDTVLDRKAAVQSTKGVQPMQQDQQRPQNTEEESISIFQAYPLFVSKLASPMPDFQAELMHAAAGISGEAGEIIDAVKKIWAYRKPITPEFRENMKEELGDILWYCQLMMNLNGFTFPEVIKANIEKLKKRYPGDIYSDAAALARADKVGGA